MAPQVCTDDGLREELLRIAARPSDPASADRLWGVLDDYDTWPGRRLVGEDGERAAWLVVQHGDTDLARRALPYLEAAVDCGDAHPSHYACVVDRLRMADGRAQVFGSQFVAAGSGLAPWPIENPLGVDERRRRFGLEPLATQRRRMEELDARRA